MKLYTAMLYAAIKHPIGWVVLIGLGLSGTAYGQLPDQDTLNQTFSANSFAPSNNPILGDSSDYLDSILGDGWSGSDDLFGDILGRGNSGDILGDILNQDNGRDLLGQILGQDSGSGDLLGSILNRGDSGNILGQILGQDNGSDLLGQILGQDGDLLGSILNRGDGGNILGQILGQDNGSDLLGQILGQDGDWLGQILGQDNGSDLLGDILGQGDSNDILGKILNGSKGDLGALGDLFGKNSSGKGSVDIAMPSLGDSFNSWATLARGASGSIIDNLTNAMSSGPSLVIGSLGVPDVLASQAALRQSVLGAASGGAPTAATQGADRFNVNPHALSSSLGGEVSRAASIGFAHTLLSEQGQQAIQQEIQTADETLQTIVETAEAAQDLDVTQDVMKQMTLMLAQQSSLDVAQYGQTIQLRQQFAADALVQAEAAEELSTLNRRQNSDDIAAAAEVIQSSATLLLF